MKSPAKQLAALIPLAFLLPACKSTSNRSKVAGTEDMASEKASPNPDSSGPKVIVGKLSIASRPQNDLADLTSLQNAGSLVCPNGNKVTSDSVTLILPANVIGKYNQFDGKAVQVSGYFAADSNNTDGCSFDVSNIEPVRPKMIIGKLSIGSRPQNDLADLNSLQHAESLVCPNGGKVKPDSLTLILPSAVIGKYNQFDGQIVQVAGFFSADANNADGCSLDVNNILSIPTSTITVVGTLSAASGSYLDVYELKDIESADSLPCLSAIGRLTMGSKSAEPRDIGRLNGFDKTKVKVSGRFRTDSAVGCSLDFDPQDLVQAAD